MVRRTDVVKMYGPYTRKQDKRKHFVLIYANGDKGSLSYPKWLMEQHLGRLLEDWETVDHINNDETDDRIENLQILSLTNNILKQAALKPREMYSFICPVCKKTAIKEMHFVRHNLKRSPYGPFCGRSCAGKFNAQKQYANRKPPESSGKVEF